MTCVVLLYEWCACASRHSPDSCTKDRKINMDANDTGDTDFGEYRAVHACESPLNFSASKSLLTSCSFPTTPV